MSVAGNMSGCVGGTSGNEGNVSEVAGNTFEGCAYGGSAHGGDGGGGGVRDLRGVNAWDRLHYWSAESDRTLWGYKNCPVHYKGVGQSGNLKPRSYHCTCAFLYYCV